MRNHMRRPPRLRPQVERLESVALLSVGAGLLTGTAHGTFFAHRSNAQSGVVYNLFASGRIGAAGPALVAGGFQTAGFTPRGAGGGNIILNFESRTGTVFVRVVELGGPTPAAPGEYEFAYQIVPKSGAATGARGSGTLDVTLRPAKTNVQGKPFTNPGFFGNATLRFA
jgi:hypothetical protein